MLHSKKRFVFFLSIVLFVFSGARAQERSLAAPEIGSASRDAVTQIEKVQQKRSAIVGEADAEEPFRLPIRMVATALDRVGDAVEAEQPAVSARNVTSELEKVEFKPFIEADSDQMRRDWNLATQFPRRTEARSEADGKDTDDDPPSPAMPQKFHWKPAIYQSLLAQGFQHSYALVFQEKTQRALKGPFFRDYWESIKGTRGWSDGNRFFTNYIAHPMQGSMTGFIYLQNHDRVKRQMFNESAQYWKDRASALLWSAAWSTNWELGPISQASLGNVGYYGHGGYVDLVITPTVGTAWMITEEALDRYIIRHAEKNLAARIVLRTVLNPTRSVANVLRFKKPWYRDRAN
jgi:hypothetical protein